MKIDMELMKNQDSIYAPQTADILPLTLISEGVSWANFQVKYYNPHKDDEYRVVDVLSRSLALVINDIGRINCKHSDEHKTETRKIIE